ncbi:hypothetical protein EDB86DRAFT_3119486 [Lactarius hatsudake]|nr:hypothetical protein EDB86DRAFT_3119486 [Lactarius hatsudake]
MPRTSHDSVRGVAKRESVMAPGSIEDLPSRHYSTSPRRGLLPKEGVRLSLTTFLVRFHIQRTAGLVPAIGSLSAHIKASPLLSGLPELDSPPSPALLAPSFPPFTPYVKTFDVDPENLWPGITQDDAQPGPALTDTRREQRLRCAMRSRGDGPRDPLCPELSSVSPQRARPAPAGFPTSLSTSEPQKRRVHVALNVLTLLRELEESACDPLSDDAYDAGSGHSLQGHVASPTELSDVPTDASFSVSVMQGRTAQVNSSLDEEEDEFDIDEESGRDRLYKQDIEKQRGVIARYLEMVDEVLFGESKSVEARCMSRNARRGKNTDLLE